MSTVNPVITLVANTSYLKKALQTVSQIRSVGGYQGRIILLIGNDLKGKTTFIESFDDDLEVVHFEDIDQSERFGVIAGSRGNSGIEISKSFQLHKLYLFHSYFQKFDRILYLDVGMQIFHKLDSIFMLDCSNRLIAHSDTYPTHEWSLKGQFNFLDFPQKYEEFVSFVNPDCDYFQTGFMYFDTCIIQDQTFQDLLSLLRQFPNVRTNDQGILCLYFLAQGVWSPLPTERLGSYFLYDFWEREENDASDYIMLKYPRTKHYWRSLLLNVIFFRRWLTAVLKSKISHE